MAVFFRIAFIVIMMTIIRLSILSAMKFDPSDTPVDTITLTPVFAEQPQYSDRAENIATALCSTVISDLSLCAPQQYVMVVSGDGLKLAMAAARVVILLRTSMALIAHVVCMACKGR
jgi:hypothetical protein